MTVTELSPGLTQATKALQHGGTSSLYLVNVYNNHDFKDKTAGLFRAGNSSHLIVILNNPKTTIIFGGQWQTCSFRGRKQDEDTYYLMVFLRSHMKKQEKGEIWK